MAEYIQYETMLCKKPWGWDGVGWDGVVWGRDGEGWGGEKLYQRKTKIQRNTHLQILRVFCLSGRFSQ